MALLGSAFSAQFFFVRASFSSIPILFTLLVLSYNRVERILLKYSKLNQNIVNGELIIK